MRIAITIDVETSTYSHRPLDFETMVRGRLTDGEYGVSRIRAILDEYGFKATFFVDALAAEHYGEKPWRDVCQELTEHGHEIGLHTHPHWVGAHYWMNEYDEGDQRRWTEKGRDWLRDWTEATPVSHRAGGFGADDRTLKVLESSGMLVDSSLFPHYPLCQLKEISGQENLPHRRGTLLEVPMSYFRAVSVGPWVRYRMLDLNACSLSQLTGALRYFQANSAPCVLLLLHSFSLLTREEGDRNVRHNRGAEQRLREFCDQIAAWNNVTVSTLEGLQDLLESGGDRAGEGVNTLIPAGGITQTYLSYWSRYSEHPRNRKIALAGLMGLILLLALVLAALGLLL